MMKRDILNKETARWEAEGIITSAQRERILLLYPEEKTAAPVTVIFTAIGSLLIGAGCILIFAVNWYRLPIPVKLTLAVLPVLGALCFGGYTLLRRFSSAAFREAAGVFIAFAVFASIALIGQIFHSPSDLLSYIMFCAFLIIPAVYLFGSNTAAVVYTVCALYVSWCSPEPAAFLFFAAVAPYLGKGAFCSEHRALVNLFMTLLCACAVNILLILANRFFDYAEPVFLLFATGLALLLLDISLYRWGKRYMLTPAKLAGAAIVFVYLVGAAAEESLLESSFHTPAELWICGIAAAAYIIIRVSRFRRVMATDICMLLCVGLALLCPSLHLFSNIALFSVGTYYIILGAKQGSLKYLNPGMILVMYSIVLRFFDWDTSLLLRGILFIALGTAFLAANLVISKKRKKGAR